MAPIALQLHTVREIAKDGNHWKVLEEVARIGYKAVEGGTYGEDPDVFLNRLHDLGLTFSSAWGQLPEPGQEVAFADRIKSLGTNHAVLGFWIPEFETVDTIKALADRINAVLPRIKAEGVDVSIHNHWIEFETRGDRLAVDYLLEFCPGVLLELDIYWAANHGANKPEEMAKRYGEKVKLAHVKDGPMVKGEPMVAVGQGKVDIRACLGAMKPEWLIVELDDCATDMMTAVRDSYDYMVGEGLAEGNRPV